jgi:hypothetical protein
MIIKGICQYVRNGIVTIKRCDGFLSHLSINKIPNPGDMIYYVIDEKRVTIVKKEDWDKVTI